MSKRLLVCAVALLLVATLGLAKGKGTKGSWTGYISDSACAAKDSVDKSKHPADCINKCVKGGAKLGLYTADKKFFTLDPQDKAVGHEGHHVTVHGSVEGDTIHVKSIEMVAVKKG